MEMLYTSLDFSILNSLYKQHCVPFKHFCYQYDNALKKKKVTQHIFQP